jgi:hypothetical protein
VQRLPTPACHEENPAMKKTITAAALLLLFAACKKDESPSDGCIERFTITVTDHSINSADVATVDNLFKSNNIDNSRFRYYRYEDKITQTAYPPYSFDQKTVRVDQFLNNIRLFNGDMVFNFKNDAFIFQGGNLVSETSLDVSPQLQLQQLRQKYLSDVQKNEHLGDGYKDSCISAEFGYYNLRIPSDTQNSLTKAWKVSLKSGGYPIVYYNDNDGKLLGYTPLMIN